MSKISLAIEMLEQGLREDAVRELERVLAEDIDHIPAWRLLANAVASQGEVKECYEHILRIDPHDVEAIEMLRNLSDEEPQSSGLPFYPDDLSDFDPTWDTSPEPPVIAGIDTAPVRLPESATAPIPDETPQEPGEAGRSAEALLFDDEEEVERAPRKAEGGILDNDAFFYTMILVVVVIVLVIVYFVFGDTLLPWLKGLLPG